VLFDKIASVYFLLEKYICILALEMASTVPIVSALSFPIKNWWCLGAACFFSVAKWQIKER